MENRKEKKKKKEIYFFAQRAYIQNWHLKVLL